EGPEEGSQGGVLQRREVRFVAVPIIAIRRAGDDSKHKRELVVFNIDQVTRMAGRLAGRPGPIAALQGAQRAKNSADMTRPVTTIAARRIGGRTDRATLAPK